MTVSQNVYFETDLLISQTCKDGWKYLCRNSILKVIDFQLIFTSCFHTDRPDVDNKMLKNGCWDTTFLSINWQCF